MSQQIVKRAIAVLKAQSEQFYVDSVLANAVGDAESVQRFTASMENIDAKIAQLMDSAMLRDE